jgi:hypothetical protein
VTKRTKNLDRLKTVIEQHPVALTDKELIGFGLRLAPTAGRASLSTARGRR